MRCPHSALSSESSGVRCPHSALSLLFFVCRVHGAQGWWMHVWGTVVTTTMTTSALGRGGKRRAQAGGGPSQPPQLPAANKSQRPTRRTQVSMRLSLVWEWLLAHVGASGSHPHAAGTVRPAGRYPGKLYGKKRMDDIYHGFNVDDAPEVTSDSLGCILRCMADETAPRPPNFHRSPPLYAPPIYVPRGELYCKYPKAIRVWDDVLCSHAPMMIGALKADLHDAVAMPALGDARDYEGFLGN